MKAASWPPLATKLAGVIYLAMLLLSIHTLRQRLHLLKVGYDIGRLKDEESELLQRKSFLTMQLSAQTTRLALEEKRRAPCPEAR